MGVERSALLSQEANEALCCFQDSHEKAHIVPIRKLLADVVAGIEPWLRERSIDFEYRAANDLPAFIFAKEELLRVARCVAS